MENSWPQSIYKMADEMGLPEDLISAIIEVESSGNPWACRYEPAFYKKYIENLTFSPIYPCSLETEKTCRAMSWGLMQIMGQTARELGYKNPFLSNLCEPIIGIRYGCLLLLQKKNKYFTAHGWPGVIASYNTGSPRTINGVYTNQGYVDKILFALGGNWPK